MSFPLNSPSFLFYFVNPGFNQSLHLQNWMCNFPTSECLEHHSSTSREVSFGSTKPTLWRLGTRVYDQPEGLDSCCMISGFPQQCDWLPPSCSVELPMGLYAEPSLTGRCWEQGWTACPISSTLWHPGYCVPAQGEQAGQRLPETFWHAETLMKTF